MEHAAIELVGHSFLSRRFGTVSELFLDAGSAAGDAREQALSRRFHGHENGDYTCCFDEDVRLFESKFDRGLCISRRICDSDVRIVALW